jgi:hypothetical protein
VIAYRVYDSYGRATPLDLNPNTTFGIEINSPFFRTDQTPGTVTYPVTLPATRNNRMLLGFPEMLANQTSAPIEIPCQLFLEGVLWRIGVLRYRGYNSDKGGSYSVNFQADAGDFQSLTRDVSLRSMDLGTDVLSLTVKDIFPAANYALFPVRNGGFYDSKNEAFQGYLNYYQGGGFRSNATTNDYAITPFPYLVGILKKVIETYGYYLKGTWLEEEWVRRLVIYNNNALDKLTGNLNTYKTAIAFCNHVPDMKVGEFLQAIRILFGLAYQFDATTKTVEIIRLKEVIADLSYLDWTPKAERNYSEEPADANGFTLRQQIETSDDLNQTLSTGWADYKVGSGRQEITTAASTLHMVRETDPLTPARQWLLPATKQQGTSLPFETGDNSFSLRLLSYQGLQADSQGNTYPLGTAVAEKYSGTLAGAKGLQWAGTGGRSEDWSAWLDFLAQARPIERTIRLNMVDLVSLNPAKKIMIQAPEGTVKAFWNKISLTASLKDGIGKAKVSFIKTPL